MHYRAHHINHMISDTLPILLWTLSRLWCVNLKSVSRVVHEVRIDQLPILVWESVARHSILSRTSQKIVNSFHDAQWPSNHRWQAGSQFTSESSDWLKYHPFASERFPEWKIQISKVDSQKIQIKSFLKHVGSYESVVGTQINKSKSLFRGGGGPKVLLPPPLCTSLLTDFNWSCFRVAVEITLGAGKTMS